jgi:hypothetical protein
VSVAIRGTTVFALSCVLISKRDGLTSFDLLWAGLSGPAHRKQLI